MNVRIGFPPSPAVFSWLAVRDHYRRLAYAGQCMRTVSRRARVPPVRIRCGAQQMLRKS